MKIFLKPKYKWLTFDNGYDFWTHKPSAPKSEKGCWIYNGGGLFSLPAVALSVDGLPKPHKENRKNIWVRNPDTDKWEEVKGA